MVLLCGLLVSSASCAEDGDDQDGFIVSDDRKHVELRISDPSKVIRCHCDDDGTCFLRYPAKETSYINYTTAKVNGKIVYALGMCDERFIDESTEIAVGDL
jgi:hypothetical protein